MSHFSCDSNWQRTSTAGVDDSILSKAVELQGLSVVGGTGGLEGWDVLSSLTVGEAELKQTASNLLARIRCSLPIHYQKEGTLISIE